MPFNVLSGKSEVSIPVADLVGGKSSGVVSLPGVGAVQRVSLLGGETGEIIRLDHHLTFVRGGETAIYSRHAGQDLGTKTVGPGAIHVRPAIAPHLSRWSNPVELTIVSLEVRYLQDNVSDLFRRDLVNASLQPAVGMEDAFLWQLGMRLDQLSLMEDRSVFIEQILSTMAMHLALTASAGPILVPSRALTRAALNRVTDHINEHLTEDLRLSTLAGLSGLSIYHFSRQFSREMGIGVGQYIQLCRMRHAVDLLHRRDMSMADVSEAVGYRDASSFSRAFRKVYGVPPATYRRNASNLPAKSA